MSCALRARRLLHALTAAVLFMSTPGKSPVHASESAGDAGQESATSHGGDSTDGSGDTAPARLGALDGSGVPEDDASDADAPETASEHSVQAHLDRIASLSRWARELTYDPMSVSVEARAASFRSVEEAVAWVRDNIALEVSAGSIRGGRGTLLAGSGSALDRALLLGALAEAMGYDWRIVRGRLPANDAARLLQATTPEGRLSGSGVPHDAAGYRPSADARRHSVASDHFWVRVRDRGTWRDADPTVPWVQYGEAAVPSIDEFQPAGLDAEFAQHAALTLRATDERGAATTLIEHRVTLPDLAYRSATVNISRLDGETFVTLEVAGTHLNAEPIPSSSAHDVELEFSLITRTTERRFRRDISRFGDAVPEAETHVLLFLPGPVGEDYLHAVLAVLLGDAADDVSAAMEDVRGGARAGELSLAAIALSWAHVVDRVVAAAGRVLGAPPAHDAPRVLIASSTATAEESELRLDALLDAGSTLPIAGIPSATGHAVDALRGLIGAAVADELVRVASGATPSSPGVALRAARDAGASFVTVHGGTVARLPSLGLPDEIERLLTDLVTARGGIAIAPNRLAPGSDGARYGWWELIPGTAGVRVVRSDGVMGASAPLLHDPTSTESAHDASTLGRIALVDSALRVAQHVVGPSAGDGAACSAICDLREMRRSVCSDERDRTVPTSGTCLRGESRGTGVGFLPVGRSCSEQLMDFYCGAAIAEAAARGELSRSPAPATGTPPSRQARDEHVLEGCACAPR